MKNKFGCLWIVLVCLILTGCSSRNFLLPHSDIVTTNFGDYEQVVANYSKIKVGMTEDELRQYGVYDGAVNVKILNWMTICKMFPRVISMSRKAEHGVLDFLDAGDSRAKAFEIKISSKHQHREGSFILDTLSFVKKTRVIGYEFDGLILLVDGRISYVFRSTGGLTDVLRKEVKPLGPLQSLDKLIPEINPIPGTFDDFK